VCVSHRIGSPPTALKPGGRHLGGRLDFICNAKYYCLAIFLCAWVRWLTHIGREVSPSGLKTPMLAHWEMCELKTNNGLGPISS
jgi:hypothetical protein